MPRRQIADLRAGHGRPVRAGLGAPTLLILATLLYPFAAIWLLWGGQIWVPISAILALVVGVWPGCSTTACATPHADGLCRGRRHRCAIVVATLVATPSHLDRLPGKMSDADFYPGFLADSGWTALGHRGGGLCGDLGDLDGRLGADRASSARSARC